MPSMPVSLIWTIQTSTDRVNFLQKLTGALRYTPEDVLAHEKIMKLVPTFRSTLTAFAADPPLLQAFITKVSAYMRSYLLLG
jgi:hypothetical protein